MQALNAADAENNSGTGQFAVSNKPSAKANETDEDSNLNLLQKNQEVMDKESVRSFSHQGSIRARQSRGSRSTVLDRGSDPLFKVRIKSRVPAGTAGWI